MTKPPELEEIRRAAGILAPVAVHTPLIPLHARPPADDVRLKLEIHQPIQSFKIRGVFHAVSRLSPERRSRGLSTVSAGNTAQALAYSARYFGVPARSLMPESAPRTKVDAVRRYGGEPVLVPVAELFAYLKERGWEQDEPAFIHPWIEREVMVGHGTLGLEILSDWPEVETVFVPVGGGGLLAGVATAIKSLRPEIRIVAVEPEGCPSLHASVAAGRPVEVGCRTICDGVAVPYVTDEMFPLLRRLADRMVLVPETAVRDTIRRLLLGNRIVVEPAGALSVAAALAFPPEERGRTVCLVTGGSIDLPSLLEILRD